MTKVAFIPPLGWERWLNHSGDIRMALAVDTCMAAGQYLIAMREASDNGAFVILDNGEAEGSRSSNKDVVGFAQRIRAKEIVLPDVMGERHLTIARVAKFFDTPGYYWPGMQYMAVVQSKNLEEAKHAIHYFANFQVTSDVHGTVQPITTLGIPRNLITVTDHVGVRIDLANWILDNWGDRFQIHFLGAHGKWPREIFGVHRYAPHVRSIDTSMPFVFGMAGVLLETFNASTMPIPTRPENYLHGNVVKNVRKHVARNIQVYTQWTEGR